MDDNHDRDEVEEKTSEETPAHGDVQADKTKKRTSKLKLTLKNHKRLVIITAATILLIGGAGAYAWYRASSSSQKVSNAFQLAVKTFEIVSTVPGKDATNVDVSSPIVLNFSQPVDPAKLTGNLFVTPKVDGIFTQGDNASQAIFTPTQPFTKGTKVTIMLNGTYQSIAGAKLGAAYMYGFTTSIPADGVAFEDQLGLYDNVTSLPSGQKENYTLHVGTNVGTNVSVSLYKGSVDTLLHSLVYKSSVTNGYTLSGYSNLAVSTDGLQQVGTPSTVADGGSYTVQQSDGIYVAVATDASGKEVGFSWVNFSPFGVILRQDDQKVVFSAQNFADSADVAATLQFYNLNTSVKLLSQKVASGLTTASIPFTPSLDIAVGTYNGQTVIVPVNILNSGGDIRVDRNLATSQQTYALTDKPSYKVGESVQFAGVVRNDNDAQYTNPATGKVAVYVRGGSDKLATFSATIGSDGMISGSFTPQSSWLTNGDAFDQFHIYAAAVDGVPSNDVPLASFTLTTQSNAASKLQVSFAQADYLPTDSIVATVTGTDTNGQPLANTSVELHSFAQSYYENDAAANLASFGPASTELPGSPTTIKLDGSGKATYTVKASSLPSVSASQKLTIEANLPNTTGVGAAGGATAIVHQGDGYLTFGLTRQYIPQGNDLVSQIYATHLDGSTYANASVKYSLTNSDNAVIASGSATTDGNGGATVTIPAAKLSTNMHLFASLTDTKGNVIQATTFYTQSPASADNYDTSGASLLDLNVTGSSSSVTVGDTVSLKVNAPADIKAVVTYDRGRIYHPTTLNLHQGDNDLQFQVGADLAPSFTITFNYFLGGVYHSEGVLFNVNAPAQKATVKISAPSSVVAGKPSTLTLTSTASDSSPLQTNLVVSIVSANAYDLTSLTHASAFDTLFSSRAIMTSSSSSLSAIGSGGGRCGTGSVGTASFASAAVGTTLAWQPNVKTNAAGVATVNFTPPAGNWVVNVFAVSGTTQVGNQSLQFKAQ